MGAFARGPAEGFHQIKKGPVGMAIQGPASCSIRRGVGWVGSPRKRVKPPEPPIHFRYNSSQERPPLLGTHKSCERGRLHHETGKDLQASPTSPPLPRCLQSERERRENRHMTEWAARSLRRVNSNETHTYTQTTSRDATEARAHTHLSAQTPTDPRHAARQSILNYMPLKLV